LFKIIMGNSSEFQYGSVTDYSIKTTMNGTPGRGWTWGVIGQTPIAALSNDGQFNVAKTFTASTATFGEWPFSNYGTNVAFFGHAANAQYQGGYALMQLENGSTFLNSPESISFRIHDIEKVKLKNNGDFIVLDRMAIGEDNIILGSKLTVDGRVYISDHMVEDEKGFTGAFLENSNYQDYLLWVEEGIVCYDLAITELADWPDYVFNKDYKLPSLKEIETHIKEKGHMHTFPSAETVEKNGITVKNITKSLVQTVEELTLHTIEKEKKIEAQQETIQMLSEKLNELEKKVANQIKN